MDLGRGLAIEELEKLIGARDYRLFLNTRNELYRERKMKENPPPRQQAIRLMAENPNLVRRPILVKGRQVIIGYEEAALAKAAGAPADS